MFYVLQLCIIPAAVGLRALCPKSVEIQQLRREVKDTKRELENTEDICVKQMHLNTEYSKQLHCRDATIRELGAQVQETSFKNRVSGFVNDMARVGSPSPHKRATNDSLGSVADVELTEMTSMTRYGHELIKDIGGKK